MCWKKLLINYKYASLPELNEVLKLYNVAAGRGNKDSKMYERKGLMYSVLDDKGNKIGIPIKASDFYNKPTLKNLEKKFVENEKQKQVYSRQLQTKIKWVLMKKEQSFSEFTKRLSREGINLVARQSTGGNIYGITYIDFKNKCVFNGSDLGKEFSVKGIMEQLRLEQKQNEITISQKESKEVKQDNRMQQRGESKDEEQGHEHKNKQQTPNILELLMKPERNDSHLPYGLLKKKKKKLSQSRGL